MNESALPGSIKIKTKRLISGGSFGLLYLHCFRNQMN